MQYFKQYNTIFIHIPKTGGSFIESNLKSIFKYKNFVGGHTNYIEFEKNIKDISELNIFTIVRNPYERTISAFNYLKKQYTINGIKDQDYIFFKRINIPSNLTEFIDEIYIKFKESKLDEILHSIQQYKFLIDKNNNICQKINILKFESLSQDFLNYINIYKNDEYIYNKLYNCIYKNIDISLKNKAEILTVDNIKKINEIYHNDFALFGYEMINI